MRALGMPGFTDAGVSSAPLERQRYRGNRGPQVACNPSAHMSWQLRFAREQSPTSTLSFVGSRISDTINYVCDPLAGSVGLFEQ